MFVHVPVVRLNLPSLGIVFHPARIVILVVIRAERDERQGKEQTLES